MFADTDAGSVITAAQSGAVWGYKLLLLQILLIPIVYMVQELAVRLGLVTGKGHGELIREHFGKGWAWLSVSTLMVACLGALVTEFAGVAGAGLLFGIPPWLSVGMAVLLLSIVAWTGSYLSVERIAILIGSFELVFLVVAWWARPSPAAMLSGLTRIPWRQPGYMYLAVANIGAVIMPWMVFYHQSAVVDKGMTTKDLRTARRDTAIGAVITQLIMIAILVTVAATIGVYHPGESLNTVQQIADALTPFLGKMVGTILFALGMVGASLVAAIVVSLATAWGLGEVSGYQRSLEHQPRKAPWFYIIYTAMLVIGGITVVSGINLVNLSVAVQVMNAALLPVVLGFLYMLALKALPEPYRLQGGYSVVVGVVVATASILGMYAAVSPFF
ncbi:MAG TPA: divalent metal cation transporter [Nitrospirae bacterium]|nr:divalent metal cation transporter [Nitrospirota bacterium]HDO23176.1 divalent metal cation transporter [Nitrospirota bacterium]HDZ88877.1 divalent metal cation transporter [Nitrospirota bacterium]